MTTLLRAGRLETDDEAAACAGIRKPCIAPSAATPPRNARRRMLISLAILSSPRLRKGSPFTSPQQTQAYRLIFRSRQRKSCLLHRAKKFFQNSAQMRARDCHRNAAPLYTADIPSSFPPGDNSVL